MGTQPDEVTGHASDDAGVDEIAAGIDETREDLTATVRQIGARLEPANLAREARESVTGAAMGKVEMMSIGAQETWRDVRSGDAGSLLDMVRENPVPAGMVGLGLAMLFLNRGSRSGPDRARGGYRPPYTHAYGRTQEWYASPGAGRSPVDQVGAMATNARAAIGDAAETVGDRVGEVAGSVGDAAGSVGRMASDLPDQAGMALDNGVWGARRMLEDNPLGAGIIALAAGAAIGMLLPTTSFERENVGPVRDQVVDQVATAAEDAVASVASSATDTPSSTVG